MVWSIDLVFDYKCVLLRLSNGGENDSSVVEWTLINRNCTFIRDTVFMCFT